MKKSILFIASICIMFAALFFIFQDKLIPKKTEIDLEDSYIIYEEKHYNNDKKDGDVTRYEFTKDKCIIKGYWEQDPSNVNYYKEYTLDQSTYLEVMNVLINEMNFFTTKQYGPSSSFQITLEIKNGNLVRNIEQPDTWEQIKKLMNATDPPM